MLMKDTLFSCHEKKKHIEDDNSLNQEKETIHVEKGKRLISIRGTQQGEGKGFIPYY